MPGTAFYPKRSLSIASGTTLKHATLSKLHYKTYFVPFVRSLSIAHGNKLKMFLDCNLLYNALQYKHKCALNPELRCNTCIASRVYAENRKLHCSALVLFQQCFCTQTMPNVRATPPSQQQKKKSSRTALGLWASKVPDNPLKSVQKLRDICTFRRLLWFPQMFETSQGF